MTSDNDHLTIHQLHGQELLPWLDGLGALRISVFHEYPYLYDGNLEYEREYLSTYIRSEGSMVALVTADSSREVLGATTCIPLVDEGAEFQQPFLEQGCDLKDICYFGESILTPSLRGRGIGKQFFQYREAHARNLGFKIAAFCAVDRPADHPLCPPGYRKLDQFWLAQGFKKHPELQATFVWKEIQEEEESPKTLTFWLKDL